jgi:hypothetical protein
MGYKPRPSDAAWEPVTSVITPIVRVLLAEPAGELVPDEAVLGEVAEPKLDALPVAAGFAEELQAAAAISNTAAVRPKNIFLGLRQSILISLNSLMVEGFCQSWLG